MDQGLTRAAGSGRREPMRLRAARVDDVETLFDIRCSVGENHQSRAELAEIGVAARSVAAMIAGGDYYGCIAEPGGAAIAFAMAQLSRGQVFACFVRPGFERRGAGALLLGAVEDRLARAGVRRAWLSTANDRALRAFGFYSHLGWREDGLLDDGEIRLVKDLPTD